MSRYITQKSLEEEQERVRAYFADRQKAIDDIEVPDMMKVRKAKGYYDGKEVAGTKSMEQIKSFWKVPQKAGPAIDDLISYAKVTAAAYTGGLTGATTAAAGELSKKDFEVSGWINFDDSDAALDKGDSSGLWYYLTKDEQDLVEKDDSWQTASTIGSVLLGVSTFGLSFAAGAANPNIRESLQEAVGMRHPDLLTNAIKRRNADLQLEANIENSKIANTKALKEVKDQYDLADMSSTLYVQKIAPIMQDIERRSLGQAASIPMTINIPSADSVPVDFARGRGLNNMSVHLNHRLAPHKIQWERQMGGGKHTIFKRPEEMTLVRY
jgi:hypothetical protein